MKVIYMGRKPSATEGLKYLIEKGATIPAVVAPEGDNLHWKENRLIDYAREMNIPVTTDTSLYKQIKGKEVESPVDLDGIDLVVSFLFWKRIKQPLIDLPNIGCVNFHPAPLPEFRGLGGYNVAIFENLPYWGVSGHYVDEDFDTGDLIKVNRFPINPTEETAFSLEQKTQGHLVKLFKEVIDQAQDTGELPRSKQTEGRYLNRDDMEGIKKIDLDNDSPEVISRRIRAGWYPPYQGANITIDGKQYTLVDETILKEIGEKYHD